LERDPAQERVVAVLACVFATPAQDIKQTRLLTQASRSGRHSDEKGRGIYIFGGVGGGKTMLMHFFFESSLRWKPKRRYIFTSSMVNGARAPSKAREKMEDRRTNDGDPLSHVVTSTRDRSTTSLLG